MPFNQADGLEPLCKKQANKSVVPFKRAEGPELLCKEQANDGAMPFNQADGLEPLCKEQANDGVARRAGRSPERSEGSSRSKRRAALATIR